MLDDSIDEGANVINPSPWWGPEDNNNAYERSKRRYRNELAQFFFIWRRHGDDPHPSEWDGATLDRKVKSRIKKLPIKTPYKGPGNYSGVARRYRGMKIWTFEVDSGPRDREPWARARSRWLEQKLRNIKMRHIKTLGWGGLGVVNLFEKQRPDGQLLKVVCKVDIEDDPRKSNLWDEIQAHIATAGAMHVSQRIPPGHLAQSNDKPIQPELETDLLMMGVSDDEGIARAGSIPDKPVWDSDQVLFLEFMSRGDLRKTATKVSTNVTGGGNFPPLALWHIFSNLFKGVIGLAYPPDSMPPMFRMPYMADRPVPLASESSLRLPKLTPYCKCQTIVHFDLDMTNVLVGDYDTDEHNILPIAKIADLGLCKPFDHAGWDASEFLWSCRRRGKRTIYTPEQFTEEWDHIKDNPRESGATTAGNYNWWTNLYQLGIIMYGLITLCEFEAGPTPTYAEIRYPDRSRREVWGYGMDLLYCPYSNFDFDLVNAVAACLCHDPADRPDMHDLERLIESKVGSQPADGHGAKFVRDWGRRCFGGAPPPSYKKMPLGKERLELYRDPVPGFDFGGPYTPPAIRQFGLLGLTEIQKARLDEYRKKVGLPPIDYQALAPAPAPAPAPAWTGQQPGPQAGRGQAPIASPPAPAGTRQQPGPQTGRGQQRGAWAAGPPGQQPGAQARRGQGPMAANWRAKQPAAQGGRGQKPQNQAGRGRGQQPQNQGGRGRGRGHQRGPSGAVRPGQPQPQQQQQPRFPPGRGQQPATEAQATADRWRQAGFQTGGNAPSGYPSRKGG